MYLIVEDMGLLRFARDLGRSMGKRVRYISDRYRVHKAVETVGQVSPREWVQLFIGAGHVVTNSFHGVAFAVNLGLPFTYGRLPGRHDLNSRIDSLLSRIGLNERMVDGGLRGALRPVPWASSDPLLAEFRKTSLGHLASLVNGEAS